MHIHEISIIGNTLQMNRMIDSREEVESYLVTSLVGDTVGLTRVLGHQSVHVVDDISSDGSREHSGQGHGAGVGTIDGVHIDSRTAHLYNKLGFYL